MVEEMIITSQSVVLSAYRNPYGIELHLFFFIPQYFVCIDFFYALLRIIVILRPSTAHRLSQF